MTIEPKNEPKQKLAADMVEKENIIQKVDEIGGRGGLDPTRYNDWEVGGRCVDF